MGRGDTSTLDLPAAALRADAASCDSSRCSPSSSSRPSRASRPCERHKVGGFRSKRREVRRIAVALGEEHFELSRDGRSMRCTRNKVVRGIALKPRRAAARRTGSQSSSRASRARRAQRTGPHRARRAAAVSPLFHRSEERAAEQAASSRRERSRALGRARRAVARADRTGTHSARRRRAPSGYAQADGRPTAFTSDLSVSEWSAARTGSASAR